MLGHSKTFFVFCIVIVGVAIFMFQEYASYVPVAMKIGKQAESALTGVMNSTRGNQDKKRIRISPRDKRIAKQNKLLRGTRVNMEHRISSRNDKMTRQSKLLRRTLDKKGRGISPWFNRIEKKNKLKRSRNITSPTRSYTPTLVSPEVGPERCEPHRHVGYIKTHKTGSTTLETIFNRFGFLRDSSFIFNTGDPYGHFEIMDLRALGESAVNYFLPPLGVREGDYANYKNYDTFAIHVRFFRDILERYMASGMRYVSSVRDPADQWESAFNQFNFRSAITKVAGPTKSIVINDTRVPFSETNTTLEAINEFLRAPEIYHHVMKSGNQVFYHFAHNDQMYDLSTYIEDDQLQNEMLVNQEIGRLARDLDFVIVNEYFDESLLVMKKELCWNLEDILYIPKNMRAKKDALPEETRAKIRAWNHADTLLHRHFNQTLWEKIAMYGPEFSQDLLHFRQLLGEVKENCTAEGSPHAHGFNYSIRSIRVKPNSSSFCRLIAEDLWSSFSKVFQRQKRQSIA